MSDEFDAKQDELRKLQDELNTKGMSRRKFLDRLAAIGIGFGAAAAVARSAEARPHPDSTLSVGSTNPAVGDIINDGHEEADANAPDGLTRVAYRRYYRRFYRRHYRRYGRFYRRYARFYRRYGRFYRRYGRFYRRYGRF